MGWFTEYLFALILSSLSLSLVATILAALSIALSPALWLIPAVITLTFAHHMYILFHGNSEAHSGQRIYSSYFMSCAFVLAFLWIATLATSITLCCLLFSDTIRNTNERIIIWMPTLTGISFLESMIITFIAVCSQKEWKKIEYKKKWRWRTNIKGTSNASPWRQVISFIQSSNTA